MTEPTMPRETGSEKADTTCPSCGGPVPVLETAYGSVSPGPCPKCHPATEKAAADEAAPREVGTNVEETLDA